jgi:hypothetical protein
VIGNDVVTLRRIDLVSCKTVVSGSVCSAVTSVHGSFVFWNVWFGEICPGYFELRAEFLEGL